MGFERNSTVPFVPAAEPSDSDSEDAEVLEETVANCPYNHLNPDFFEVECLDELQDHIADVRQSIVEAQELLDELSLRYAILVKSFFPQCSNPAKPEPPAPQAVSPQSK